MEFETFHFDDQVLISMNGTWSQHRKQKKSDIRKKMLAFKKQVYEESESKKAESKKNVKILTKRSKKKIVEGWESVQMDPKIIKNSIFDVPGVWNSNF